VHQSGFPIKNWDHIEQYYPILALIEITNNKMPEQSRTAEQQFYISLPWDVKIDSCIEMAKDTLW